MNEIFSNWWFFILKNNFHPPLAKVIFFPLFRHSCDKAKSKQSSHGPWSGDPSGLKGQGGKKIDHIY